MLNPTAPTTEFFAPSMVVLFAVLAVVAAVSMYFYQRGEAPGRWRRQWPGRIAIPVVFAVVCGFVGLVTLSFEESAKSESRLMAKEIERVYGIEVTDSEASKLMDGKTIVIYEEVEQEGSKATFSDGTAYRLEGDRLVEATGWEDTDVPD